MKKLPIDSKGKRHYSKARRQPAEKAKDARVASGSAKKAPPAKAPKPKFSMGYILAGSSPSDLDEMIIRGLEGRGIGVVRILLEDQMDVGAIAEKTKDCRVVFNYSVFEPITFESIELTKTLEELGKKVIESSHSFFYQEDKWMFYLKCLEAGIPTPKTYLIPKERPRHRIIRDALEQNPLVLKAVFSDEGRSVTKVSSYPEFIKKLHHLAEKNPISPIIAQDYLQNPDHKTYRATLINNELRQFIEKINKNLWKQTGMGRDVYRRLKAPKEVITLCEKASKAFGIKLCGLDLMLNDGDWYVIEANSSPGLFFINADAPRLAGELAGYLASECRRAG